MKEETKNKIFKWNCILSVVIILLLSTVQHSLYELIPNVIIGAFAPRNESLAEHVKIVLYPILIWWVLTYLIWEKRKELDGVKWFTSGGLSIVLAVSLVTSLFCTFVYGLSFPIDSFLLHIGIEIFSILIAQTIAFHVYKRGASKKFALVIIIFVIVGLITLVTIFSFNAPNTPIFISPCSYK